MFPEASIMELLHHSLPNLLAMDTFLPAPCDDTPVIKQIGPLFPLVVLPVSA